MSEETPESRPTTKATKDEILLELWKRCLTDADATGLEVAVEQLEHGHRIVEAYGERFEVTDPDWSIVQDVYGCEQGRDCADVTPAQREQFEATIAARLEAES